jgi:hypothetical protein
MMLGAMDVVVTNSNSLQMNSNSAPTTGPVAATERQVREDLAILKVLGLANSNGHGRGVRWKLL